MSIIPVVLGSKSGLFPLLRPGSLPADTACLALGICRQQRAWSYRAHTDTLTVPDWDTHRINTGMDLSEDWLLSLAWGKKINACVVPLGTRKNDSRGTELPAMIPPSTILLSTFCDSIFGTPSFILPVLLVLGPCYQQGLRGQGSPVGSRHSYRSTGDTLDSFLSVHMTEGATDLFLGFLSGYSKGIITTAKAANIPNRGSAPFTSSWQFSVAQQGC